MEEGVNTMRDVDQPLDMHLENGSFHVIRLKLRKCLSGAGPRVFQIITTKSCILEKVDITVTADYGCGSILSVIVSGWIHLSKCQWAIPPMSQSLVSQSISSKLRCLGRRIRWIHVNRISVRRVGQPHSDDSVQCDVVTCIFSWWTAWPQLQAPAVSGICHMNREFRLGWKSRMLQVIELEWVRWC